MIKTLTSIAELEEVRAAHRGLVLLDVRLPEDHAVCHIPRSVNQCVFEVAFLPGLEERGLDKATPLVVYGNGADSQESSTAAEKLVRAGYKNVFDFVGGLDAWMEAGLTAEASGPGPLPQEVADGTYPLDLKESRVVWVGRNLINRHWGHVALASGQVEVREGRLAAGEVVLDLRRIMCSDLADSEMHDVLIHHLESDDFFDVARYPEARFAFDRAEECDPSPGTRNLRLHGGLTLRGVTHPLTVEAAAGFTPEGLAALQSTFTLDRTQWGVVYGSGRLFRRLAGHLVNDEIELQIRMLTASPVRREVDLGVRSGQ